MSRVSSVTKCLIGLAILSTLALACQAPSLPAPFATPTPSATRTPTPTPTPTPPPTPTATPRPSDLLALGQEALFVGDIEGAILAFQSTLGATSEEETVTLALLGLGRAYLHDSSYLSAAEAFEDLLTRFPSSPLAHRAHFLLGEALIGAGEPLAAAEHYRAYLEGDTAVGAYVYTWLADALYAGADYAGAIDAYRASIEQAPTLSFEVGAREKLILAHSALEEYEEALAQYDAILEQARIPEYRARIMHQSAQMMLLAGQTEDAWDRHLKVVDSYPTNPWAYESLVVLVDAGVEVDDLTRGIVDYYGGAYGPAVAALYRYIESDPAHSGAAHYYAGLAHLAAGSPALAENQFQTLVETHPESTRWGDAWIGWGQALAAQGDTEGAVEIYRSFVEAAQDHGRAHEALWRTGQLLEAAGEPERAAAAYEDCQAAYPSSDYAAPALFRGGLQRYQLGEVDRAILDWRTLATAYEDTTDGAAGSLWLGKAHLAAGNPVSATTAFSRTLQAHPTNYYGLRASDLTDDPLAAPFPSVDYVSAPSAAEQAETEAWLADWLELESPQGLGDLSPALRADPRLERGLELWDLGRRDAAKAELEALRRATVDDPLTQYRLALLFRDIGLYRSSILAATNLINLSPADTALDAPVFLARLAYPTYYEDLVLSNAVSENLSPLLLFSLIRQESLFEGFATSYAYAQGLMQVIPSTGASIANQLGWPPGYENSDLYRPVVSLRFGTWYLAQQRNTFDGRLDVALAAYNGGPGNAAQWIETAGSDPDLFLETITLSETNLYLRRIREHYAVYSRLYGPR